jgi:hypothetical protein
MMFIRNHSGSHNPSEAVAIEDFMAATRILAHHSATEIVA